MTQTATRERTRVGVCPTCQQQGFALRQLSGKELEEMASFFGYGPSETENFIDEYGTVFTTVLVEHNHQGGARCEGSGQTPQATYLA